MSARALRTGNVGAAALFLGGLVVMARPEHALSVLQVVVVTIATAAGLHALAAHVPPTAWMSPFRWMSPFLPAGRRRTERRSDELRRLRARMSGRRQPVEGGPPLPPETLRLLQALIRSELGLDRRAPGPRLEDIPGAPTPLTRAILGTKPLRRPPWYRTRRADPRAVAEVVHSVLDDLERHVLPPRDPHRHIAFDERPTP